MALRAVPLALRAFQWSEAVDNSVYLFQGKTGSFACLREFALPNDIPIRNVKMHVANIEVGSE